MEKYKKVYEYSNIIVNFIKNQIEHICTKLPTRSPGTKGEEETAFYLERYLKEECDIKETNIEHYDFHPTSFYGWLYITTPLTILGVVLSFIIPIISLILFILVLVISYNEFYRYKQFVDPLFKKKTGTNLTAIKRCKNPKKRIFFTGHMDAAWEFTYNYHFGTKGVIITMLVPFIGILYYLIINILLIINPDLILLSYIGLIFLPFTISLFFFWNPFRIVPGANDNLTGCLISVSLLKTLKDNNIDLETTEVGIILTGSEEAGLRGAKAWAEKHQNDYNDIPTYIVVIDTINDPKELSILTKDLNGTVTTNKEIGDKIIKASKELNIYCDQRELGFPAGSTDSAAFTQKGFKAIGLVGMSFNVKRFYHTRLDTHDNLNDEAINNCYKICMKVIEDLEEE